MSVETRTEFVGPFGYASWKDPVFNHGMRSLERAEVDGEAGL